MTKQKYFFLKYSTILAPPKPILIGTVRTSSTTREKISSLLLIHNILPHSQQNQIESFEYQHSNTGTQIIKRVSPIQSFCVSSRFSSSLCTYVETHRSEYIDAWGRQWYFDRKTGTFENQLRRSRFWRETCTIWSFVSQVVIETYACFGSWCWDWDLWVWTEAYVMVFECVFFFYLLRVLP